jgi:hypothetical protein
MTRFGSWVLPDRFIGSWSEGEGEGKREPGKQLHCMANGSAGSLLEAGADEMKWCVSVHMVIRAHCTRAGGNGRLHKEACCTTLIWRNEQELD